MKIAVTGSSGLIGTAVVTSLQTDGHEVLRLVRRAPRGPHEVRWDPQRGEVDLAPLAGLDAAVHLAGAGVADHRWTDDYKRTIRESRVLGTRTLVAAMTALDPLPSVLVSGSAVGFYGSRGDEELTEGSTSGDGFLAEVVRAWEAEAEKAAAAGIRTSCVRTGLVMSRSGGAFERLLRLARFGLGGPLGSGRQWWSWITLDDEVGAIRFLLDHDVPGPVNLTAPDPQRQADVVRAIAARLRRPALLPAPSFALRAVLGGFSEDILASQRVAPRRLLDAGYAFRHPDLASAATWLTA